MVMGVTNPVQVYISIQTSLRFFYSAEQWFIIYDHFID